MTETHAHSMTASTSPALKGVAMVPGDKSVSHRALILGAMADGETTVSGLLEAEDVLNTAKAVAALGAGVEKDTDGIWHVRGLGTGKWRQPAAPLDFGNSGTGSRLMMGALATSNITATFTGDASLQKRPMARVLDPLKAFGCSYQAQDGGRMPLTLTGAKHPAPAKVTVTVASAQVKSALLLAALNVSGESEITQNTLTRDHTERMLAGFGADITVTPKSDGGETITISGPARLNACDVAVPRDPSSAAFPMVAALICPKSDIRIPGVLLNSRRTGLIRTLLEMEANIVIENIRTSGGEEIGDLRVRASALKGVVVPADRAADMIDEYPVLAVAAAFAGGKTVMHGLGELKVKESDRLAAIFDGLQAAGVTAEISGDTLTVTGMQTVPGGGMVATHMDHRIAMSFLVMGLASAAPMTVDDTRMIATSFPEFVALMQHLGANFA